MSPEERQLLVELFQRTNGAASQPRDRDAEAFIAEAVRLQPFAPYLLAQTVIVQEQALKAAADRLQQLEAENRDLKAQADGPPQQQGGFLGGLGGLFGGGQQAAPPPPPRQGSPWGGPQQQGGGWNAPQQAQQGGPWGGAPGGASMQQAPAQGGGFLKGALGMAAGVAGGALLANSISGLFHGQGGGGLGIGHGLGSQAGAGAGGGETIVNNYYGDSGAQHASAGSDDRQNDAFASDADYQSDGFDSDDGSYDA